MQKLTTKYGEFKVFVYPEKNLEHFVLVYGDLDTSQPVLTRIHSECLTGDVFGSLRCDCGPQLEMALELVSEKSGIIVYLRQEGRGIGLANKIKAYDLQDQGYDTVDANLKLGFEADARNYLVAINILKQLGVSKIDLMTNNPHKLETLVNNGIEVCNRIPLIVPVQESFKAYMETKRFKLGHII